MKRRIYDVIIGEVIMAVAFMLMVIVYDGIYYIDMEEILQGLLITVIQLACGLGIGLPIFTGILTLIDTFKKPAVENEEEVIEGVEAN